MRTNPNDINIHLLLSNDINRLRETGKEKQTMRFNYSEFLFKALAKLLKMTEQNCKSENVHNYETM
jgi:hypothetical protein